jgi:UDP-2-acetamido-2,6-beta-L-arabino-hexul-4-ose reductase
MKTVAITGADGFMGVHARIFFRELEKRGEARAIPISRTDFENDATLARKLSEADGVLHLAGINRGSDEELESGNSALAKRLVAALENAQRSPHILFASSIHEAKDTPYGRGKREAGRILKEYGTRSGAPVTLFVLPHVFGEFAKPYYNSAVATFAADLAAGKESEVNPQGNVELIYVRDVIQRMHGAFVTGESGSIVVSGKKKTIPEVYALLKTYAEAYRAGTHPDARDPFNRALFNTLQSAFYPSFFPRALEPHEDERGVLYEVVRSFRDDQVFYSVTKPGKTRGNHYHTHKMERFCVISGEGEIRIRPVLSEDAHVFKVSGEAPVFIDMPTYSAHHIVNTGTSDLVTLFWVSEQYNPEESDTFPEPV